MSDWSLQLDHQPTPFVPGYGSFQERQHTNYTTMTAALDYTCNSAHSGRAPDASEFLGYDGTLLPNILRISYLYYGYCTVYRYITIGFLKCLVTPYN